MKAGPIGVFDSGVGGLTIVKEIDRSLPLESVVHLGDSKRAPYGELPVDIIRAYALEGLDYLYAQGVKALVIACNTATAVALEAAQNRYDVPVVGVIEATARACALCAGQSVGIIGTSATVASGQYARAIASIRPEVQVVEQPCPLLAGMVEAGVLTGSDVELLVAKYLEPLHEAGVDTLVLGCTHYPFVRDLIESTAGPGIKVIESGQPVVAELKALVRSGTISRGSGLGSKVLATTGDPVTFQRLVTVMWPDQALKVEQVDIEVFHEQLHLQAA